MYFRKFIHIYVFESRDGGDQVKSPKREIRHLGNNPLIEIAFTSTKIGPMNLVSRAKFVDYVVLCG